MSIQFDVNACLEAAMRANPNASREFLTRALSQTLTNAGQETKKEDVDAYFDGARVRVGAKYMGAPLHANPAARLQAPTPKIRDCAYVRATGEVDEDGDLSIEEDETFASQLGSSLHSALKEQGELDADAIFLLDGSDEGPVRREDGSLIVRVSIDENGEVGVLNVVENEAGDEAKVRRAFQGLVIPQGAFDAKEIAPGTYDFQIGFAGSSSAEEASAS